MIEDTSPNAVREILEFSARDLVQTVLNACLPDIKVPAGSLVPEAMQRFLESLSIFQLQGNGSAAYRETAGRLIRTISAAVNKKAWDLPGPLMFPS